MLTKETAHFSRSHHKGCKDLHAHLFAEAAAAAAGSRGALLVLAHVSIHMLERWVDAKLTGSLRFREKRRGGSERKRAEIGEEKKENLASEEVVGRAGGAATDTLLRSSAGASIKIGKQKQAAGTYEREQKNKVEQKERELVVLPYLPSSSSFCASVRIDCIRQITLNMLTWQVCVCAWSDMGTKTVD